MSSISPFYRGVALPMAAILLLASLPIAPASAGLVPTEAVVDRQAGDDRAKVTAFLARDDVRRELTALGIAPDEAAARVAALSDDEISQVAGRLSELPAGGDGLGTVVGAAVLIFIVLLITDIAGLTKVFPFTRSAR